MDKQRVKQELARLNKRFTATWDSDVQAIRILDYPFPRGWMPRKAPLLLVIPESYPQRQPDVCIRAEMHYRGLVNHRMRSTLDGWHKWCFHTIDDWDPAYHDVGNVISIIRDSFRNPADDTPYQFGASR